MKTNIIKTTLLGVLFGCYSCSDFLDRDSLTNLSTNTFWKTEKDVQSALTAAYSGFRTQVYSAVSAAAGVSMDIESLSDNASLTSSFQNYNTILKGGINASTGGAINAYWTDSYAGIAACNYFLDNIDNTATFLPSATLEQYKGEALFVRAFFYNELVQLYGAVPLTLKSEYVGSGYDKMPRTAKNIVVEQLLSDLDIAIPSLPNIVYSDGHAVRGSAILLKVRILMNNQRYKEAADAAWTLIGDIGNPFKLADNYAGIFFGEQIDNPEIMFSIMYTAPSDYHSLDQMVGSRMSCFPTQDLRNAYEANDPRLGMTILQIGDPWVNNPSTEKFEQEGSRAEGVIPYTNMAWKKWINPSAYVPTGTYTSDQHIVKMRYADLLLLYAEAMFEDGKGDDSRALKALNDVRARKGVEMAPKEALTREIIRNERRIELAYEGLRYNDLIRWNIAKDIIPTIPYDRAGTKRTYNGPLFPVPQTQMDIMYEYWTQNDNF